MTPTETEKAIAEVWALFKETRAQMAETDRKIAKVGEHIDKVSQDVRQAAESVNKITGKWGIFVESIVAPSIIQVFKERGIHLTRITRRISESKEGDHIEIDILATDGNHVVVVEVKSTLGPDDINQAVAILDKFRKFFPEYANRKILGAVAGIEITQDADRYAYRKGLFVLVQAGESIKIANDDKFKPKEW